VRVKGAVRACNDNDIKLIQATLHNNSGKYMFPHSTCKENKINKNVDKNDTENLIENDIHREI
jgi:hypothetical protein